MAGAATHENCSWEQSTALVTLCKSVVGVLTEG